METTLSPNLQRSGGLCFPNSTIKGVYYIVCIGGFQCLNLTLIKMLECQSKEAVSSLKYRVEITFCSLEENM